MSQKMIERHPSKFQLSELAGINQTAREFKSSIRIRKGGIVADAKVFPEVIQLLEAEGRYVEITVEGEDAPEAVRALREALEQPHR